MKKTNDFSANLDKYVQQALERHAERRRLLNSAIPGFEEAMATHYVSNDELAHRRQTELLNTQAKVQQSLFDIQRQYNSTERLPL